MAGLQQKLYEVGFEGRETKKTKREAALKYQKEFEKEGHDEWFDMLIGQTDCATEPVEQFKEKMGRSERIAKTKACQT